MDGLNAIATEASRLYYRGSAYAEVVSVYYVRIDGHDTTFPFGSIHNIL
jgi:hypothetical protein